MTTRSKFLIFALPRTGSTTLGAILGRHPDVRYAHEPFNKDSVLGKKYAVGIKDERSLDIALREVWKDYDGIKHVWEHCSGWPFGRLSPKLPLNQHLLAASDAKVIFLARRNVLRRVVSNEISLQTRQWTSDVDGRRRVLEQTLEPLDIEWVKWQLERERTAIAEHRERLVRARRPFIDLWYEDLYAEDNSPDKSLHKLEQVISFLELAPFDAKAKSAARVLLDPRGQRVNSHDTYSRIPNIEQIERMLGSDETGWLFK